MPTWLALVGAYVIGSLDFAFVVARAKGVDITTVGSGNPGTSNVLRTLGRGPAAMVLVGDLLKGVIAAAIGWVAAGGGDVVNEPLAWAAGFLAVVGHAFPILHGFKGGKGVATGGGVLFFTVPLVAVVIGIVWGIVAKAWKVASVASLLGLVLTIPGVLLSGVRGDSLIWFGAMLVLIIWRHRPNIERMLSGSEQKVPT
jgi:glycerol-3-phosphate acyltransferase PlsY